MPSTPLLPHRLFITGLGFDPNEFFVGCNADVADGPGGAGSRGLAPTEQGLTFNVNRGPYALAENDEWLQTGKQARTTVVCDASPAPTVDCDFYGPLALEEALIAHTDDVEIRLRNGVYDASGIIAVFGDNITIRGTSNDGVNGAVLDFGAAADLGVVGAVVRLESLRFIFADTHGLFWTGDGGELRDSTVEGFVWVTGDTFAMVRGGAYVLTPGSADSALHLDGCSASISQSTFITLNSLPLELEGVLDIEVHSCLFTGAEQIVECTGIVTGRGTFVDTSFANLSGAPAYLTAHSELSFGAGPGLETSFHLINCLFDIRNCSRFGVGAVDPYVTLYNVSSVNTRVRVEEGTYYRDDYLIRAVAGKHVGMQVDLGPAQATDVGPLGPFGAILISSLASFQDLFVTGQKGVWDRALVHIEGSGAWATLDGFVTVGHATWSNTTTALAVQMGSYAKLSRLVWNDTSIDPAAANLALVAEQDAVSENVVIENCIVDLVTMPNIAYVVFLATDGENYWIQNNSIKTVLDGTGTAAFLVLINGAIAGCTRGHLNNNYLFWDDATQDGGGVLTAGPVRLSAGTFFWEVTGNVVEARILAPGPPAGRENLIQSMAGAWETTIGGGCIVGHNVVRNSSGGAAISPHVASASGPDVAGFIGGGDNVLAFT